MSPAQHVNDHDQYHQQEQGQLAASQIHAMQQQTFSFIGGSSSGWRGMWLVGVAQALKEREFDLSSHFIGESNGAFVSAALALGDKDVFRTIRDSALSQYEEASETHNTSVLGRFHSETSLFDCMKRHANLHKFKELNSTPGRLTVVYSSLSAMKIRRTAEFESEDQLEQVLLASCSMTPSRLNGEWVIGASVFGNQEALGNDCGTPTIQVSTSFSSNADIKPSRYIPQLWSVMPPSRDDIVWLFDLGYEDGLQWIQSQSQSLLLLDSKTSSKSLLALVPPPHTAHRYSGNAGTIAWLRTIEHMPSVLFNVTSQTWKWFALYLMLKLSFPGPRRTRALKVWKAAGTSPGTTHLTSKMAQWRVVNWLRSFLLAGADNASKQITGTQ